MMTRKPYIDITRPFKAYGLVFYDSNGDEIEEIKNELAGTEWDKWSKEDVSVQDWKEISRFVESDPISELYDICKVEFDTMETCADDVQDLGTLDTYMIDWMDGRTRVLRVVDEYYDGSS